MWTDPLWPVHKWRFSGIEKLAPSCRDSLLVKWGLGWDTKRSEISPNIFQCVSSADGASQPSLIPVWLMDNSCENHFRTSRNLIQKKTNSQVVNCSFPKSSKPWMNIETYWNGDLGIHHFKANFQRPPNFWPINVLFWRNHLWRIMLPPIFGLCRKNGLSGLWENDAGKTTCGIETIVVDRCHHLQLVYKTNLMYCDLSIIPLPHLGQSEINLKINLFICGLFGTLFVASSHLLLDKHGHKGIFPHSQRLFTVFHKISNH